MSSFFKQMKAWLPPLAGLCVVFISAGYAWSLKTSAAQEIDQLHELGSSLDSAAQDVGSAMLSPEDVRKLEEREKDLRLRMDDAIKPGLVQADLMASARKARLDVREIQPIAAPKTAGVASPSCPNYRVSVAGTYQQIAEYMHLCKTQRLPVRVTGFRVGRQTGEGARSSEVLTAEITVEAFEPRSSEKQGA